MGDVDVFAGLDAVAWQRLRHAYGSAAGVPAILRDLVDPDPAVREVALEQFYGAVHHQGDVYRCTLETLPFLTRIATTPGLPGRAAAIELLASVGGATWDQPLAGRTRTANATLAADRPRFLALLHDADAHVRAAVVPLLRAIAAEAPEATAGLLRRHADAEPDPLVRRAIVTAVARLATADPATIAWLEGLTTAEPDAGLRLGALAALARLGVPAPAETAVALIAAGYSAPPAPATPAGLQTDTLVGRIREMREQLHAGRGHPQMDELVRAVSDAYGDRVESRIAVLLAGLRSADAEWQLDALHPASNLVHGWRGRYTHILRRIADLALTGEPVVRPRAAGVLGDLGRFAAPVADALAGLVESAERRAPHTPLRRAVPPWIVEWPAEPPTVGRLLALLARLGDPRAVPMLAWVLEQEPLPSDAGWAIAGLGPVAAPLAPAVAARLDDPLPPRHRDGLVAALRAIGPAAAREALPVLLAAGPDPVNAEALGQLGAADPATAGTVLPVLRGWAAGPDARGAVAATLAAWTVDADTDTAVAALTRHLGDDAAAVVAARALRTVSAAGPGTLDRLGALARRRDQYGHTAVAAAHALAAITGDAALVRAPLEHAWARHPLTRPAVVAAWAELGPPDARTRALLAAELAEPRRLYRRGGNPGFSYGELDQDEAFVAAMRALMPGGGGDPAPAR
ncbi:hypothetical protein ACQP1P_33860 [Dactylosporangium sp. CA-052675]|uniref:hypothetical protein n=1 Tax=Dactylosporangium sp. CA-052675 TaxID=3239927 RepID=UPI003D901EE6